MNKELEFIRKAVIMACHPECKDYGKALEKELGYQCLVILKDNSAGIIFDYWSKCRFKLKPARFTLMGRELKYYERKFIRKIMGRPITLDRILRTIIQGERSLATSAADLKVLLHIIYDWDYDSSTLQEQTEEIILSISKLLGYEK